MSEVRKKKSSGYIIERVPVPRFIPPSAGSCWARPEPEKENYDCHAGRAARRHGKDPMVQKRGRPCGFGDGQVERMDDFWLIIKRMVW